MKICCSACGATPYARFGQPQGAILRRVRVGGEWARFCADHLPPGARSVPRLSASPLDTLAEIERLVTDEADYDEIRRAVDALRKTIAPPREPGGKARKPKKPIALAGDDPRQATLIDDESAEPSP
jgi:hypothetical protein